LIENDDKGDDDDDDNLNNDDDALSFYDSYTGVVPPQRSTTVPTVMLVGIK
jgi:hypothetical protein